MDGHGYWVYLCHTRGSDGSNLFSSWWLFTRSIFRDHHGQERLVQVFKCLNRMYSNLNSFFAGDGALGISNSLGSSSLNILFSLGFPWFLRTIVDFAKGQTPLVNIYNNGMEFTIMILLLAILSLYLIISCTGYRLTRLIGASLFCVYVIFVTIGILMNMGILFSFVGGSSQEGC